ncbi:type III restriction endonuclease subunit R, partial [candidate division KSB1 bacterium]|nr:type III restriction endonuclease subunit R [candidate division KSB1 bacterium]NIS25191.1 type III restriction endonuclease subunit R [candidate division KSB1 bacterium]NIT72089.1 type III restriction endonuclease subunit R [candidate division KSB1 bacterium]NIU25896.1 type III restriction endonuclease subunit R [candidate division KSB1 bacterium]NIU94309.1 type III restriction endonuclease subunit R [candidate division KSB1 bacterium]
INPETGRFDPEYVNIFGVPFTFLPHESTEDTVPQPPTPKTAIEPIRDKEQFEIRWPNLLRVEHVYRPQLQLDMSKVRAMRLDAYDVRTIADLAPI